MMADRPGLYQLSVPRKKKNTRREPSLFALVQQPETWKLVGHPATTGFPRIGFPMDVPDRRTDRVRGGKLAGILRAPSNCTDWKNLSD